MTSERTKAGCRKSVETDGFALVSMPVDVTDEEQFPEIAAAGRWFASLTPERREQLNKEWEG